MTPAKPTPKPHASFVRFRESHHAIARMFAAGWTISKVSHETGYTRRRLNILLSDPSFQELIAQLHKSLEDKIEDGMDEFYEVHWANAMFAARRLGDRLAEMEENEEHLPVRDYLAIVKDGADRFGYSAKTTRVNVNVDFATALDKAIERTSKVIEAQPAERLVAYSPPSAELVEPRHIEQQEAPDPGIGSGLQPVAPARPKAVPSFSGLLRRSLG